MCTGSPRDAALQDRQRCLHRGRLVTPASSEALFHDQLRTGPDSRPRPLQVELERLLRRPLPVVKEYDPAPQEGRRNGSWGGLRPRRESYGWGPGPDGATGATGAGGSRPSRPRSGPVPDQHTTTKPRNTLFARQLTAMPVPAADQEPARTQNLKRAPMTTKPRHHCSRILSVPANREPDRHHSRSDHQQHPEEALDAQGTEMAAHGTGLHRSPPTNRIQRLTHHQERQQSDCPLLLRRAH